MKEVIIISCGPGGEKYITPEAREAIEYVDIVTGTERNVRLFAAGKPHYVPEYTVTDTMEFLEKTKYARIGVLVTGDAGFFSLSRTLRLNFNGGTIKTIPGVSCVQVAFARIGQCWSGAEFHSVHGREGSIPPRVLQAQRALILCDARNCPQTIIPQLQSVIHTHEIWVLENLTLDTERIIRWTPETDISDFGGNSLILISTTKRRDNLI